MAVAVSVNVITASPVVFPFQVDSGLADAKGQGNIPAVTDEPPFLLRTRLVVRRSGADGSSRSRTR